MKWELISPSSSCLERGSRCPTSEPPPRSRRRGGAAAAAQDWALREEEARRWRTTPVLPTGMWRSGRSRSSLRAWRRPAAMGQA
ncbi:Dynein heavy chain 17, axonemal [Manis javanica]|nr:Dynein heavy chain 17, axonemal [Manis javanica]